VFGDSRGLFFETFNETQFKKATGLDRPFVQAQAKLVRVASGRVLDVVVDLRKESPSFGKSFSVILDDEEHLQLYVPRGFAHGFVTLSEKSIFCYKCDNYYDKASEGGIIYNDATLAIDWHLPEVEFIVSEKDLLLPSFEEAIQ
jgi:dTDP-4-dehydrorhamnose 3,5-epimerase